jgi:nicotinamide mononucleotide transporter
VAWLTTVVAPLNDVVFHVANDAVSWAELLGFVSGLAAVWLTVKRRVANFPVGIANSMLFLALFASARLWADAALQVVFAVLAGCGWWQWLHVDGRKAELRISRAPRRALAGCAAFTIASTLGLAVGLSHVHDVAPFWDALTTSLSLAAQWLLNAKRVENWWWWMAADCIYIPLYATKRLDLTAAVYVLFLALCVQGLRDWKQTLRDEAVAVPQKSLVAR